MNEHVNIRLLEALVRGELSEDEFEVVSQHTSHCDTCLAHLDQLWAPLRLSETQVPALDPRQAKRMERQLVRHLHREALSANMIWLATKGLLKVMLTLIRPFFSWMALIRKPIPTTAPKESNS